MPAKSATTMFLQTIENIPIFTIRSYQAAAAGAAAILTEDTMTVTTAQANVKVHAVKLLRFAAAVSQITAGRRAALFRLTEAVLPLQKLLPAVTDLSMIMQEKSVITVQTSTLAAGQTVTAIRTANTIEKAVQAVL